jgi:hypothetical protein
MNWKTSITKTSALLLAVGASALLVDEARKQPEPPPPPAHVSPLKGDPFGVTQSAIASNSDKLEKNFYEANALPLGFDPVARRVIKSGASAKDSTRAKR